MKLQKFHGLDGRNRVARAVLNPSREEQRGGGMAAGGAEMTNNGDAANAVTRNLRAAIERVREDVAKVEFWADAVTGFSQPVPEYRPSDVNIWMPAEQAKKLGGGRSTNADDPATKKRTGKT
jgi:hypothetical protein